MTVLNVKRILDYCDEEPKAGTSLRLWYAKITGRRWPNPNEVMQAFPTADIVGNGRIVFNIAHNKHRLIVKFDYESQTCYVRFVGPHKKYDKIKDVSTV